MKIGILGGGQLARMIMEECYKYGFEFHILSNEENSPAGQLTKHESVGDWNDEQCLKKFAEPCDIITLENEFIGYQNIRSLEKTGKPVYPDSGTIKLIQDKLIQKETLKNLEIPVAEFCGIETREDVLEFTKQYGFPVVLKSRTMGYDGKGNYELTSGKDIDKAFETLSVRGKLMCERFVNFDKEIAVQVARNKAGELKVYPVVETIQKDHICNVVIASRNRLQNIRPGVEKVSKKIAEELDYTGVMGIELFLTGNEILVNELAPRVHNSGHYTIEGCYTSQFENHIRAIMNFPLGSVEMRDENAVMVNIIGKRNGKSKLRKAGSVLSEDKVFLHTYGKHETKIGRKMGHITVLGNNTEEVRQTADKAVAGIDI